MASSNTGDLNTKISTMAQEAGGFGDNLANKALDMTKDVVSGISNLPSDYPSTEDPFISNSVRQITTGLAFQINPVVTLEIVIESCT